MNTDIWADFQICISSPLNYVAQYLLILVSTITGCVSISGFVSLACITGGITSSAAGIEICAIIAGIKK